MKKLFWLLIAVLVFTALGGEALASATYTVSVKRWSDELETWIPMDNGRQMTFEFNPEGQFVLETSSGFVMKTIPTYATHDWSITFDDWILGYSVWYDASMNEQGDGGTLTFSPWQTNVTMYVWAENNR